MIFSLHPKPRCIEDMPNITIRLAEQLRAIGIYHSADLCTIGAEEAWHRLNEQVPTDLHVLLALEGAIQGLGWRDLPAARHSILVRHAMDQVHA